MAVAWLEPYYKKYNRDADLSYADLYTFAGVVAIEALKGPKIAWRAGRKDSFDVKDVTPDGRLPDADKGDSLSTAKGLQDVFGRMGFNDREIVSTLRCTRSRKMSRYCLGLRRPVGLHPYDIQQPVLCPS